MRAFGFLNVPQAPARTSGSTIVATAGDHILGCCNQSCICCVRIDAPPPAPSRFSLGKLLPREPWIDMKQAPRRYRRPS